MDTAEDLETSVEFECPNHVCVKVHDQNLN